MTGTRRVTDGVVCDGCGRRLEHRSEISGFRGPGQERGAQVAYECCLPCFAQLVQAVQAQYPELWPDEHAGQRVAAEGTP